MVGYTLAWIIALMLGAVGFAAGLAPRMTAWGFGVPATDPAALAYVRATGSRDLVLALLLIVLIRFHVAALVAAALALSAIVAVADLVVVLGTPGARRSAGTIHAASAVFLLGAAYIISINR
jgi:Domain of unknown function (DUF4267)